MNTQDNKCIINLNVCGVYREPTNVHSITLEQALTMPLDDLDKVIDHVITCTGRT